MLRPRELLRLWFMAACLCWPLCHGVALQAKAATSVNPGTCSVPDIVAWGGELRRKSLPKPDVRSQEIRIVVLGSSSTVGTGATHARNSFVARLTEVLASNTARPHRFHIVNAGVSGETAAEMLLRLRRDILGTDPSLVIWQTGVNDAIKGIPLDRFGRALRDGLADMKSQSIPVVLVDQQDVVRKPSGDFDKYVSEMQNIARQAEVTLFHRYRVMRYLSVRRSGGLRSLLADDGLHMNDYSHRCIGELLAAGIGRILG